MPITSFTDEGNITHYRATSPGTFFQQPTAPDGEPWAQYIARVYDAFVRQDPSIPWATAEWNSLARAIGGESPTAAPFQQGLAVAPPDARGQTGETLQGLNRVDSTAFLGDQFGPAVALLGLAVGGAGAYGAFAGPGAGAAAGTGAADAGLGIGGTAADFAAAGGAAQGLSSGLLPPTLGGAGLGTAGLGAGTLGAAGGAGVAGGGGAAGSAGAGGILGTGLGLKDVVGLGTTAAGLVNAGIQQGNANDAQDNANAANDRLADAAQLQADIARQLFGETGPLRTTSLGQLQGFLTNGTLPFPLQSGLDQIRTTGREDLESQYNVARQNILGLTPNRGGQLNSALANTELARAQAVGRLGADLQAQYELPLRQQLFGRATELGFGQANNSLTGLNAATSQFGNIAANAQQGALGAQQQAGAAGQTAGTLAALALKKGRSNNGTSTGLFGF